MIRSILLPISEQALPEPACDYALWLGKQYRSHIHALGMIDVKSYEMPVLGTPDGFMPSVVAPPIEEGQSLLHDITDQVREELERFSGRCQTEGLYCSTDTRIGIPAEVVARESVAHDLVIMARQGKARVSRTQDLDPILRPVIRSSIRPVLVPGLEFRDVRRILVAYDGSLHASRALSAAVLLGSKAGLDFRLIHIATSEHEETETLGPADAYLRSHGIHAEKKVVAGTRPADAICDLMAQDRTDLLIMGAYGHSPIREMIFGSTTEKVISHCPSSLVLQY